MKVVERLEMSQRLVGAELKRSQIWREMEKCNSDRQKQAGRL